MLPCSNLAPLFLLASLAGAQAALPEGAIDGAVGDEDLKRIVDLTLPLVEKHAGRRFTSRPPVRVISASDLAQIVRAELEACYARVYPHYDLSRRKWLAGTVAANTAPILFGKYHFDGQVVYVAPDRIDAMLKLVGERRELGHALLRLVVAHELVHALQDQHAATGQRLRAADSEESYLVFSTCLESHATLIQERVAAELDLVEAQRAWTAMLRLEAVRKSVGVGITEVFGRAERQWEELSYLQAAERLRLVVAADGEEAPWRLLAAPPASSRFFLGTQAAAERAPSWDDLFAGLERQLGKGKWFVDRGPLNWLHLRSELAGLSVEEFDAFEQPLLWAGKAGLARTVTTLTATVWAMRFRDEEAAREALALSRRAAAAEEQHLRQGKGFELRRFDFAVPEVEGGEALAHELHVAIAMLQVQRLRAVWLRRGTDLVRVWDQNLGKTTEELLAVADLVLARMAK